MSDYFKTLKRANTDSAKWSMAKHRTKSEEVLTFSVADSDYETAPAIKRALSARVEHGAFGYTKLDSEYYSVIKRWMKRRYNLEIKKSWVIPVPKVLNAISVAILELTSEGDGIVIQTPVYHAFRLVIKDTRRSIVKNPLIKDEKTERYTMDYEHLEQTFKDGAKMLVLCSPHNPIGRVWTEEELRKVVSLCKAYGVHLVSDEIHSDIIMPGYTFYTIGHFFDDYENIIQLTAPSKTFNIAGLQAGQAVIRNEALRTTFKNAYKALHLTTPNLLTIKAVKAAYTECDDWVDAQNAHVRSNFTYMKETLEKPFKDVRITPLEGTYLAWVDIGFTGMDSVSFTDALALTQGVVVAEGRKFGDEEDRHIRINLACSSAQMESGLTRLVQWLTR